MVSYYDSMFQHEATNEETIMLSHVEVWDVEPCGGMGGLIILISYYIIPNMGYPVCPSSDTIC